MSSTDEDEAAVATTAVNTNENNDEDEEENQQPDQDEALPLKKKKKLQTSRKSTSGFKQIAWIKQRADSNNELTPNEEDNSNASMLSSSSSSSSSGCSSFGHTSNQPVQSNAAPPVIGTGSIGLKLVFKRQSGDKYEVISGASSPLSTASNPSSSTVTSLNQRPKREAARRVKFRFNDFESDEIEMPVRKRPKYLANSVLSNAQRVAIKSVIRTNNVTQPVAPSVQPKPNPTQPIVNRQTPKIAPSQPVRVTPAVQYPEKEVIIPFNESELVAKNDDYSASKIIQNGSKVIVNHSIPFPIALVEDKTNIVHTKALLLIHLYKSYQSPCIICVLCKCFFSISDFSKHFHITQEDLLDDEDDDELMDTTFVSIEERKNRKLAKLRKKTYKILPYCLNKNNELNEHQLKTWKLFSDRFNNFKKLRATVSTTTATTTTSNATSNVNQQRPALQSQPAKPKGQVRNLNWDRVDDKGNYTLNRARLDNEKIVYLNQNGSHLSDNDEEDEEDKCPTEPQPTIEEKRPTMDLNRIPNANEPDLSLSEDDDDENSNDKTSKTSGGETDEIDTIQSKLDQPLIKIADNNNYSYFYCKLPSSIEKHFNYYDNLSNDKLFFIESNHQLIVPQSFILYKLKTKLTNYRKFFQFNAQLNSLSSTLDLQLVKPQE